MIFPLRQARHIYSGYNTTQLRSILVFLSPGFYGETLGQVSGHNLGIFHCTIPDNPFHQQDT